jgi:hypothetical protein
VANPFLPYYAGSMAPPIRGPGNTLSPVPTYLSPEEIYAGILPPPNLPLNPPMPARPNNSWPGDSDSTGAGPGSFAQMQGFANDPIYGGGNIQTAAATRAPSTNGTTYYPPGPAYGYNALTGDYEVQQPGNAYTRGTLPPNSTLTPKSPAVAAINAAMRPSSSWIDQFLQRSGMQWEPAAPAGPAPAGDPWGNLRIGGDSGVSGVGLTTGGHQADARMLRPAIDREAQRAALMQQAQRTQDAELAAAMAKGKTSYVSSNKNNNGVLAVNALMPTVAMNGKPILNR